MEAAEVCFAEMDKDLLPTFGARVRGMWR